MFEIISNKSKFRFMEVRHYWVVVSLALCALSIAAWIQKGDAKYGVDFKGGTEVVVHYEKSVPIGEIRDRVSAAGFPGAVVQAFEGAANIGGNGGADFSIRARSETGEDLVSKIHTALQGVTDNPVSIIRLETVGPVIGSQILGNGIMALVLSMIGMVFYLTVRFDLSFATGAIVSLIHDVIIVSGVYVVSGREVGSAFLAAILTLVGYSVNDTIIVFDRIRENIGKALKTGTARKQQVEAGADLVQIINMSLNQTLSRTILTAFTVFLTALMLWLFGGGAVADLSFAMVIGVLIGTYSSIFVASPYVLFWRNLRAK